VTQTQTQKQNRSHDQQQQQRQRPGFAPQSGPVRMLMCFSLYRNLPKLLSTKQSPGAIHCFNGMRASTTA
jgi:hypothetical protein